MTQVILRYNDQTNRVTQTYWGDNSPEWADKQRDGATVTTTETSQQARTDAINSALDNVEAGTDYDSDTETPVAHLLYDPDTDTLDAEVVIEHTEEEEPSTQE